MLQRTVRRLLFFLASISALTMSALAANYEFYCTLKDPANSTEYFSRVFPYGGSYPGPEVAKYFEEGFTDYLKANYSIGTNVWASCVANSADVHPDAHDDLRAEHLNARIYRYQIDIENSAWLVIDEAP